MPDAARDQPSSPPSPHLWLVRIAEVFEGVADEVLARVGATLTKRLGQDFYLIKTASPEAIRESEAATFIRWNLPMGHAWPCNPRRMDGFIEKAAQTLSIKFGSRNPQALLVGQLNPTSPDPYFKGLASNLRGRALQLFSSGLGNVAAEDQDPARETLFCLVGKEGLFCGMRSPSACNGLYPGGSKFIDQDSPDTISRAGAKVAEAIHYLLLHRPPLTAGSRWLELGAAPGGMTSELLARGYRVTAIDRAPLDRRLKSRPGLESIVADVASFTPEPSTRYDAILSDLNGPPRESMAHVIRVAPYLQPDGLVVFTLKLPRVTGLEGPCALSRATIGQAAEAGLRLIAQTHLTYNRHEFTLFFEAR